MFVRYVSREYASLDEWTGSARRCYGSQNRGSAHAIPSYSFPPPKPRRAKVLAIGKRWLRSNRLAVRDVDAFFMWHKVALCQMTRIFLGVRPPSLSLTLRAESRGGARSGIRFLEIGTAVKIAPRVSPPLPSLSYPHSRMGDINFAAKIDGRGFCYIDSNGSNDGMILVIKTFAFWCWNVRQEVL